MNCSLILFFCLRYATHKNCRMSPFTHFLHLRYLTFSPKVPKNASQTKAFLIENQPESWQQFRYEKIHFKNITLKI
jgi:hypothetical protein